MSKKIKLISIVKGERDKKKWHPLLIQSLSKIGDFTCLDHGDSLNKADLLKTIRENDIIVTSHGNIFLPKELAEDPGRVKYICHIHGTIKTIVPPEIICSDKILVTNWGSGPAYNVAEGAMALTLAALKDFHKRIMNLRNGHWSLSREENGGSLNGLKVGIFGAGFIGRKYIEMIKPFNPEITVYDPFVKEIPEGCTRVESLEELFKDSQLVAIHAGLTPETEKIVTAELLAMLPTGGVLINTARGKIVDQEALFSEIYSGRLRAGIDVFETDDPLPSDHPIRTCENMIYTTHSIGMGWPRYGKDPTQLNLYERTCIGNITKFLAEQPIENMFIMDKERYNLST